ncbi:MAG: hypothetical protein ACJA2G_001157 [Cognaticolwellia sp.]|jgi:hypothetical protein
MVLFFTLRLSMLYLLNKTDQFIEADQPMKVNLGSEQIVKENKDVVRLVAMLARNQSAIS